MERANSLLSDAIGLSPGIRLSKPDAVADACQETQMHVRQYLRSG